MSEPSFRPVPSERRGEFWQVADYAFHGDEGPRDPPEDPERVADRFGLFEGEDLVSVCVHYDFDASLRGEWVPLAGLAAVATPPEHRRQGHVRRLVGESLRRWRGEFPLSALWPFDHDYYRQFGWTTANRIVECTCPVEELAFALDAAGRPRRVTADEWPVLQDAHEAHGADRTLTLRRDGDWWREHVFRVGDDDRPYVYAWERDGTVRGYVVSSFVGEGDSPRYANDRLVVEDAAFADHEARLGILGFLAGHSSQVDRVVLPDADASLLDLVDDPSAVDCTVEEGPMVRVVDVPGAFEAVPYPDGVSADLTLAVSDGTAPWNDDTFRLEVTDGEGTCERSDVPAADADARLDVGTLAQLVVGYHAVPAARRLADLSVADEAVADALADLFPPETVFLRSYF